MIKNPMKNYIFWVKLIGGVILLAFGIALITKPGHEFGSKLVVGVTGGVIFVYGVFRIIPLFKTLEKGWSKGLNLMEVVVDLIIGALLCCCGFNFSETQNGFFNFIFNNYRFLLGVSIYLRGVIYFVCTTVFREKTDWQQLVVHIVCLTFGTVLFCVEQFTPDWLAWVLMALCLFTGVILTGEGGFNYFNYRKNFKKEIRDHSEATAEVVDDSNKIEAPGKEDNKSVPLEDEHKDDQTYAS